MVHGDGQLLGQEPGLLELGPPHAGHLRHLPSQDLLEGLRRAVYVALGDVSSLPVLAVRVGDPGGYRLPLASAHLGEDAVGDGAHGHLLHLGHLGALRYHRGHRHQVLLAYAGFDERYVEGVEVGDLAHRGTAGDEESRGHELHGDANGRTLLSLSVAGASASEASAQCFLKVNYKLPASVLQPWQMTSLVHC